MSATAMALSYLYVKETLFYKRRRDLEIRGVGDIWIELANNHKRVLFGVFYRPPNSDATYFSNIKDSLALTLLLRVTLT